jgi:hypothetical protein
LEELLDQYFNTDYREVLDFFPFQEMIYTGSIVERQNLARVPATCNPNKDPRHASQNALNIPSAPADANGKNESIGEK